MSRVSSQLVTLLILGVACRGGDRPDASFDASVARPAYTSNGPRVLFDEGHHNHHRANRTYRPFKDLAEADGYRVQRNGGLFSAETLRDVQVLIIAGALGTNERNDDPAFTAEEVQAVEQWVAAGGALLLLTDHYPFGHAAEALGARFGVAMTKGAVDDTANHDRSFEPTHIVFSRANGGLADHPITRGRDSSETVERVLTFTGQGISGPGVTFLTLSGTALSRPAQPVVERDGGDVRVLVAYGDPVPAKPHGQGIALEHGRGRVIVLGDMAMLTAQLRRFDGRPVGMNVAGYDNRQLALNIMHWLTRLL